ncbi:adenosylcobinamide amidohydrolase [Paenibacillus gansuensis]|uniref:Adenosylcobinamide amidohydrolase n=1 Tax=Paenibacillus gansuensis TaxID=306542 RepID=A0ABW5P9B9_9BACL
MAQPFREHGDKKSIPYRSALLTDWQIRFEDKDRIVFRAGKPADVLSSAVYGGGWRKADHLVNWKVPLSFDCTDPVAMMQRQLNVWGYPEQSTSGLQTAAHLTHASVAEEQGDGYKLLVCSTAGTSNAARAGQPRTTFAAYRAGTINIVVIMEGRMAASAMVNAVITISEAKAAALQDAGIVDTENGLSATGTTTDAVALAVTQTGPEELEHRYAGAATAIGNAIGRLVYLTVSEAVRTQKEDA